MPFPAGTRLGPYEIQTAIGTGGMGEVYKARDTRLSRPVALKVIQAAVAGDPEMRERFEREARAISALDHPHVCMLYDVCRETPSWRADPSGSAEGDGSTEPVSFLVMQYLEGETLAERLARVGTPVSEPNRPTSDAQLSATISRGPIPFDTALKYGGEIAQALDAAHRRGIVHRDLKPGNIMLTKTGTKLLDFGLAKLLPDQPAIVGDGATRTGFLGGSAAAPLTGQGTILGTLHYMSPEQLEGRDVDARTDIHAFGAVLFEMLSGRRAFDAQSQAGVIGAIVSADPPQLSTLADARVSLPAGARRALDRLLQKCLAKHPDDRWQSAADLADELTWINTERSRATDDTPVSAAAPVSRARERIWMAATVVTSLALITLGWWWYPRPQPAPPTVTFTIDPPDGVGFSAGAGGLSLSPDGQQLAFISGLGDKARVWVRSLETLTARPLEGTTGAWQPVWAPDGKSIVFQPGGAASNSTPLRRVELTGGPPRTILELGGRPAWSQHGVMIYRGADDKLYRVSDAGGTPVLVMDLDPSRNEQSLSWPEFLPDGRRYLFVGRTANPSESGLFLATLDAPGRTLLLNLHSNVEYAKGHLFYQRNGTLMAHPFDEAGGRLAGDPFPIAERLINNPANGRGAFSVSPTGVLAYRARPAVGSSDRTLTWVDRSGKPLGTVARTAPYTDAEISPDGRQLVVGQASEDGSGQWLTLIDLERGVPTRFTVGDVDESDPVWTPDSLSVVFSSERNGQRAIYRRSAGGGATSDERLVESRGSPLSFSQDGRLLLFTQGTGSSTRLWILPMDGDRTPYEAFPGSQTRDQSGRFSPDGKWIAFVSWVGSRPDIYVKPFPADGRGVRISTDIGISPRWTADGKRILYRTAGGELKTVDITIDGNAFRAGSSQPLFTQPLSGQTLAGFTVDPRGDRLLLMTAPEKQSDPEPAPITVVVNIEGLLRKK